MGIRCAESGLQRWLSNAAWISMMSPPVKAACQRLTEIVADSSLSLSADAKGDAARKSDILTGEKLWNTRSRKPCRPGDRGNPGQGRGENSGFVSTDLRASSPSTQRVAKQRTRQTDLDRESGRSSPIIKTVSSFDGGDVVTWAVPDKL